MAMLKYSILIQFDDPILATLLYSLSTIQAENYNESGVAILPLNRKDAPVICI